MIQSTIEMLWILLQYLKKNSFARSACENSVLALGEHKRRERVRVLLLRRKRDAPLSPHPPRLLQRRPYFLGKMLWEKGYDRLWDLLKGFQDAEALSEEGGGHATEDGGFALSAYGSGPDADAIRQEAWDMGLAVEFYPATDHAELSQYKTFVNPSESEVLCTTVAEALAMGKFVIIAEHASNEFFYQFPNTLRFKNQAEFNKQVGRG